jgi:hypothetical protein
MKPRQYINKKVFLWWIIFALLSVLLFTVCTLEGDIAEEREKHRTRSTIVVPGSTLAAKLIWLQTNAQSDSNYVVGVNVNENLAPQTISYRGKSNIIVTLKGISSMRTISLLSNGPMFTVGSGITIILDTNVTLRGRDRNNSSLVFLNTGGTLRMNAGSIITANVNTVSSSQGGGVFVQYGATFIMNGGIISENISDWGGGVIVWGTFIMNDGTISENTASSGGGGICVGERFIMNGGIIFGNTANWGGGVFIGSSSVERVRTFNMNGGTITSNIAQNWGGGVGVNESIINKMGGTITGYSSNVTSGNSVRNFSGTIVSNSGHAVYAVKDIIMRKESTAGPGANLWFDGTANGFPAWTGSWDF